jgi:hypothetical protein
MLSVSLIVYILAINCIKNIHFLVPFIFFRCIEFFFTNNSRPYTKWWSNVFFKLFSTYFGQNWVCMIWKDYTKEFSRLRKDYKLQFLYWKNWKKSTNRLKNWTPLECQKDLEQLRPKQFRQQLHWHTLYKIKPKKLCGYIDIKKN